MAHLQYMPGDPRLVDQLVYELKSKGIFDQFRKDCIADVDTRPAYQNLRQRVENSVSTFLSRQVWKPDLNKNQLREKLRKHILDGNYLEQGVERIVDQVVNPKVTSVFIPQVEDLVYNYLGITRKKAPGPETCDKKPEDILPTDLEAVSPGSVKSNDDKHEAMETDEKAEKMDVDEDKSEIKEENTHTDIQKKENVQITEVTATSNGSESMDKSSIPLPAEEINLENIPAPVSSPPKATKLELESIALPNEPNLSTDIPLPSEVPNQDKDQGMYFKTLQFHSEDSSSSSGSSLRRNMSPLTPIRNFNNENSCDAQQGFDVISDGKPEVKAPPSSFRFTIETTDAKITDNNSDTKAKKKETDVDLSYQFNNQVLINTFTTLMYDDSSNSNLLHIDYESDVNSKTNIDLKPEIENSQDCKKDKKSDFRKSSHKSSHRSRDSSRHSNSKDKRSDSKHSTSRDSSRHDKKSSSTKDDKYKSSREGERSKDRSERKDSRESSKYKSSHKGTSSKEKDSKSRRGSSSSHRQSSKSVDDKKSSSSKYKEKSSESSKDKSSKDKSRDLKSSSNRSDKDKKSNSSNNKKPDDKDKKKDKKDIDDHYSSSGRGNHGRRSTDRDSNDGSSNSKGCHQQNGSKSSEDKKESKSSGSKSETTSTSGDSASPSDREHIIQDNSNISHFKPIIRVDNHLETPIANPPRLPFVPDVTLKKPRFAANLQEAKKLMKMRKFLDEEQKRMNQEAALLLEFQANVRPSLSQVYSSISGPELEFACISSARHDSDPYKTLNEQANAINKLVKEEREETVKIEYEQTLEDKSADVEVANISEVIRDSEIEGIRSPDHMEYNRHERLDNQKLEYSNCMDEESLKPDNPESPEEPEINNSYDENKPFSELMDEITEYSKASESKADIENAKPETEQSVQKEKSIEKSRKTSAITEATESITYSEIKEATETVGNKYFEVTIITEELSESEETEIEPKQNETEDLKPKESTHYLNNVIEIEETEEDEIQEIKLEELINLHDIIGVVPEPTQNHFTLDESEIEDEQSVWPMPTEYKLHYFAEHEKYDSELEKHKFSNFLKKYIENYGTKTKMFLMNCDTYEENLLKEVASTLGDYEVVNYYKNGFLKLPNMSKNIVKENQLSTEITLPIEPKYIEKSPLFSPVKSECSFELSCDYDTKLDEINKKSRQEVMEIILGGIIDASPSKMPRIDYYTESNIDNEMNSFNTQVESGTDNNVVIDESETENTLKRRMDEVESSENNNRMVLTPNKIRKLSDSDQISSTTDESEEASNNNKASLGARSKYLGKARRVGLPKPKRCNIANSHSPSSDKSVENYVQNTPAAPPTPNGKMKSTPRAKIQRYDTADLYKPKLHYLSRRNNVS